MSNWPTKKLGEVCDIYQSQTITSNEILKEGPFKVFGANGVIGYYSKYNHEDAEVLVTCRGATCGTINMSEPKSWITGNAMVVHPKDEKVISKTFLFYALRHSNLLKTITGTGQPQITRNSLAPFQIPLPTLNIQKQIADVLSAYDDLIENNTKRIKILEEIAEAIYKEWFVSPASKKWEIATLRDVVDSYTGGGWGKEEPSGDHSDPAYVIRGTDIPKAAEGDVSTCPLRYHTPSNLRTRVLRDGDLVFEVSGGSKGQPVGRSLLITSKLLDQFKQNVICASFCKLIRPNQNKISPFQLYEQILSWYANGIIEKYQVQSTGISNFRFESFIDEEKVTLPPEKIREKFDHLVSPLFDELYSLGNQNQNLRQARDLLLPRLVTGEIRV